MTNESNIFAAALIAISLFGCAAPDDNGGYFDVQAQDDALLKPNREAFRARLPDFSKAEYPGDQDGPYAYYQWEKQRIKAVNGAYRKSYADWHQFFLDQGYEPDEADVMTKKMMRP